MLLAVDTSTQWMGIALYDGSQVLAEVIWRTYYHHTVELAVAIENLLDRCNIPETELKALAVAIGPGSFTGLRIGLAVMKGMSLGLRIPVVGVPTLDILASAQPLLDLPMAAVLRAGRGRMAVGMYAVEDGAWQAQGDPELATDEELIARFDEPVLLCGELSAELRQKLRKDNNVTLASPAYSARRPSFLAELGWRRWERDLVDDVASLAPVYLRVAKEIPE